MACCQAACFAVVDNVTYVILGHYGTPWRCRTPVCCFGDSRPPVGLMACGNIQLKVTHGSANRHLRWPYVVDNVTYVILGHPEPTLWITYRASATYALKTASVASQAHPRRPERQATPTPGPQAIPRSSPPPRPRQLRASRPPPRPGISSTYPASAIASILSAQRTTALHGTLCGR